jgi:membrane protein DedA with SNARE-associated domain
MKRIEYVIAGLLVIIGLACLTTSGSYLMGAGIDAYITTFLQLCFWIGVPIIVFGISYFIIKLRKGDKK